MLQWPHILIFLLLCLSCSFFNQALFVLTSCWIKNTWLFCFVLFYGSVHYSYWFSDSNVIHVCMMWGLWFANLDEQCINSFATIYLRFQVIKEFECKYLCRDFFIKCTAILKMSVYLKVLSLMWFILRLVYKLPHVMSIV